MPNLLQKTLFHALLIVALSSSALIPVYAQSSQNENRQDQQTAAEKKDNLPEIRKVGPTQTFTLDNGLQVVVIEDHRAPIVTQMVWYHVGSADEPMGRTGIAHFLEHLMFKGTKNHTGGEFSKFISKIGGEENAFTYYDYTGYYQSVASNYLEDIMRFEADRMENLVLTDEVIKPERNVIIEERRMRVDNSPGAILAEEARATLFMNSPYRNPVIGWKQEMEELSLDDALSFYNRFYTPNNASLIISGDVTAKKVRDLAVAIYGKIPQRTQIGERIRPQEPPKHTSRSVTMRDPRVSEPSYQEMWVVPSYRNMKDTKEAASLDLLGEILGGSTRSRLYQSLIVDKGLAASIWSGYSGLAYDDGVFSIYGMPRADASLQDLQKNINQHIAEIRKDGVTQAELNQSRERFLKNMIFSQDSATGLAYIYGSSLSVGLTVDDVAEWSDRLKAVTIEDIKAVAERYLDPQKSVTTYLLPPLDAASQSTTRDQENK
ncbi:M16 family metallopeptidase [Bartonella tamiae]|uniref:M16 family metallopeptidase n=1 Tax=Bartonella tamiae TaxID=373638 RepID=UPI00026E7A70|nr:pitrilysin family protein [Bartonella tamiae]EJF93422.1 hypothetical protein MEG_01253 [Bartonella tamiae Th307]